jgi:peptidyl-prolyl cis-trans isomerase SurA
MKRLLAIALATSVAASGLVALAQQTQQQPQQAAARGQMIDGVVAVVNDTVISQSDVRNRMRWMLLRFEETPSDEIMLEIQNQAIESMIDEKVQVQQFTKLTKGDKVTEAELDQSIADVARDFQLDSEQFKLMLNEVGIPLQHIRDMEEAKIAWGALIRGRYLKSVRVSELRIDDMLNRIKSSLDKPQYRIAEIFLYAPDQTSRQNALTRAQSIIQQVNQGGDFQTLAQQFSAAPSASAGGDLNWLSPGDMRPEIAEVVLVAPEPPVLLPPIESDGGIYVIALTGKRDPVEASKAVVLDLEQVIARGEGTSAKIEALKATGSSCEDLGKNLEGVSGITRTPMKDIGLMQVAPQYRTPLEGKSVGQSTDVIDLPDGGKMVFFICATRSGNSELPTREEIRDRLFNAELSLVAERYLRDLKREATVVRR